MKPGLEQGAPKPAPPRRRWLKRLGIGLGTLAVFGAGAFGLRKPLTRAGFAAFIDNASEPGFGVPTLDGATCSVTATAIEGPFFVSASPLRSDIREGQAGRPLELRLKLVDTQTCRPLAGVEVHVWHANAEGVYSGYANHDPDGIELTPGHLQPVNDQRFLRGHQMTDAEGVVSFLTVVPAWYGFRTPHVHVKARLAGASEVTTQLYFPEAYIAALREHVVPYRSRPLPVVSNRSDPVIHGRHGAAGGWLAMSSPGGEGDFATLMIVVDGHAA